MENNINCTIDIFDEDMITPGFLGMYNLFQFGNHKYNFSTKDFEMNRTEVTISEKFITCIPELFFDYLMEKHKRIENEEKRLNYIKYKIFNPLIGQASFNNIGFKDKTVQGHIKRMYNDYIKDALADIHLSHAIKEHNWTDVRSILLENKTRPIIREINRSVKKLTDNQLSDFFRSQVLYCELIPAQIASINYEEKVNAPFAFSAKRPNMHWLDSGKLFSPLSTLARLFFLVGAAGYLTYTVKTPQQSQPINKFAYYRSLKSILETVFLNQLVIGADPILFSKNFNNIVNGSTGLFEIVEFHTDLNKKSTVIDRYLVNPKKDYIKEAIKIYDYELRVPFMRSILKDIDPKNVIYQYITENTKREYRSYSSTSVLQANHARASYLEYKKNKYSLNVLNKVEQEKSEQQQLLDILTSELNRIGSKSRNQFDQNRNKELIQSSFKIKTVLQQSWSDIVKSIDVSIPKNNQKDDQMLLTNLYHELSRIKSFYQADYDKQRTENQPSSRTLVKYLNKDWKDIVSMIKSRYTIDTGMKFPDSRGKRK